MKVAICNPMNVSETKHSRKGMYVPLGILSIATLIKQELKDSVEIVVLDEDVTPIDPADLAAYDVVGFYATTFNYPTCVTYAKAAKKHGCTTILGGPHPSVLAENIAANQDCFDYIIRYEAEFPFLDLIKRLVENKNGAPVDIPNLVFRHEGGVFVNSQIKENTLQELPNPSREFIDFDLYIRNFREAYPDRPNMRQASIYSSKGCSWRDKTGGCIFCARLEKGVRFRPIKAIWEEIEDLYDNYGANCIWDISDDNLNNFAWFKEFVDSRPKKLDDLAFFVYSRVTGIKPEVLTYLKKLNVEEVFLGVESGDTEILKKCFKGQTPRISLNAATLLKEAGIKYFPSFILGLPGETEKSMQGTYNLVQQMADLGGLDRIGCTILKPTPGSRAFELLLENSEFGPELAKQDNIDLAELGKHWVDRMTEVDHAAALAWQAKINGLMKDFKVFGGK
ncbi:B12-binding domain-containing radical SAM protein [Desulfatibacillum aliphaticivorans]|uniref:B12-binding domain-containing radical SAM protein n=1 Tax=Desulfatibacillum aliphaticivorans TaxID=218208 RepID=UPI000487C564|nr:radical SAM protein [Desulfatibacillum aliphaticivorans]